MALVKAKTKETGLSSYRTCVSQNLSTFKFITLQNLPRNKDLIVPKSGRRISVAIVDSHDYIYKKNIFSDQNKFTKVNLNDDKLLNLSVKKEKRVVKFLKKEKNLFDLIP